MSRIGYKSIPVPAGVEVEISGTEVSVKGPQGSLSQTFNDAMTITRDNGTLKVDRASDERDHRALHGLTRSLLANMVIGVSQGYTRTLDLVGVGYRVQQNGSGITLNVMYSHPVNIDPPEGVTLQVEGNNRVHVRGIDKQAVGQLAAQIRQVRPPNIYTGKGIRYSGEQVRLKPGKSARRA
jgi:large subunit ribosomal protein L6